MCNTSYIALTRNGISNLRGSLCAEGMGCERRWVRWVLRGTGTDSPICEGELATTRTASLLVELES